MRLMTIRTALVLATVGCLSAASAFAEQSTPRPAQTPAPPQATTPAPSGQWRSTSERGALPQGFSVVLVLGDIQSAPASDDVPLAARKALNDMREFLPFKSYKLLDAAWLMCCGQDPRSAGLSKNHPSMLSARSSVTQILRGPDDREYELELVTSRAEGSGVFVKFSLSGSDSAPEIAAADAAATRSLTRRIADLKDTRVTLDKQLQDAKKKVEVGVSNGSDVPKIELELRRLDREIEEMNARLTETQAGRPSAPRASVDKGRRDAIIDTSFTMDVGETVVVGTSRLKGGSRALIALLTAVPPRTADRKE